MSANDFLKNELEKHFPGTGAASEFERNLSRAEKQLDEQEVALAALVLAEGRAARAAAALRRIQEFAAVALAGLELELPGRPVQDGPEPRPGSR